MRQLIIDRIPDDFHPDQHVPLGPWCFYGVEDVFREWDKLPFIDPFVSAEVRCASDLATRALTNQLLDSIWPELNYRHGVNHSRTYWHVVLAWWLLHLVQMSWRLYKHVTCFVIQSGSEPLDVPIFEILGPFRFANSGTFTRACFMPSVFRTWLLSEIVRRLAPSHWKLWTVGQLDPSAADTPIPDIELILPVHNVYGLARWRWLLSAYAQFLPRKPGRPALTWASSGGLFPAAFRELLDELVRASMPETVTSCFAELEVKAKRHWYRRGRLRITTRNPYDDQENIILGHAIDAGERLVPAQHGGTYGWGRAMSIGAETDYGYDSFITWGWTAQEDYAGHFVPLPSPLLSRNLGRHRRNGSNLILVGQAMNHFNPRIDFVPSPLEYRRWKLRFVDTLAADARQNLRYRPYFTDRTFEDGAWMRRHYPTLRLVEGPLEPALFASKLMVLDHPGTTLAMTLAANVPTIAFWDRDLWPIARQAKSLFAGLENAGIVFHDPESAATQVNSVWPRVQEWWRAPGLQEVREAWCQQFAWADRWWLFYWFRGLFQL